jgi:hypothetical protein
MIYGILAGVINAVNLMMIGEDLLRDIEISSILCLDSGLV